MLVPNRHSSSDSYRYGFQGQEKDDEIKGEGNNINYGFRVYDTRIARFNSVDPLTKNYPFYSPYQISSNSPILSIDINGMQSFKILNTAENLLYTPYEFGGKNPHPDLVGIIDSKEGKKEWINTLKPKLVLIKDSYPNFCKSCTYKDVSETRKSVYKEFENYTTGGYSLGIDCSGFVYKSFLSDNQLEFNVKFLNSGSSGQLSYFKKMDKEGKAYVHKNFNLISEGDFIYKPGHVMIATGNVKVDENGIVTSFETMEANSTDKGSLKMWRNVSSKYTIAHPFRTSDVKDAAVISNNKETEDNCPLDSIERTEINKIQNVVE